MQFTVNQIAELLNGQVEGDGNQVINQFYKIEEGKPNGISFLANLKYEDYLYKTDSTAVVINKNFLPKSNVKTTLIKVDDAYLAFTNLLKLYTDSQKTQKAEIHNSAEIHSSTKIAANVSIGAFTIIKKNCILDLNVEVGSNVTIGENVCIGKNTRIDANVVLYSNTVIGENCVIKSGVVIGSEGFGFAPTADGSYAAIPQIGNVVIENNVNIGANTCIDCGTMGSTLISTGVKIDNLVQIGHNSIIGAHTVIAAQSGIAGSVKIGKYCIIGGQVGFAGHITIADHTHIGGKAGVTRSVSEPNTKINGVPAFNLKDYLKAAVIFRKLPILEQRINIIEKLTKEQ